MKNPSKEAQERPTPVLKALLALQKIGTTGRQRRDTDGWLFALAWLAAAKTMVESAQDKPVALTPLMWAEHWETLRLPKEALHEVWHGDDSGLDLGPETWLADAMAVVAKLSATTEAEWDVLDALYAPKRRNTRGPAEHVLAPSLADYLVRLVNPTPQSCIWIPFDPSGQLTLRALRQGARVLADGLDRMNRAERLQLELLLILTGLQDRRTQLHLPGDPSATGQLANMPIDLIAMPPWGARVEQFGLQRDVELRPFQREALANLVPWLVNRFDPTAAGQERTEHWALKQLWSPGYRRGIFLLPPSILFAKGRDHRLRESLLFHPEHNQIAAVMTFASGTLGGTGIPPAALVLSGHTCPPGICMMDLSDPEDLAQELREPPDLIGSPSLFGAAMPSTMAPQPYRADIAIEELDPLDLNLQPSRYLKRASHLTGPRVPLGNWVDVVRAPNVSQEFLALPAWEIGIPQLEGWLPITGPFDEGSYRSTTISPRRAEELALAEGDLVISVKGTLGKCGIVGPVPSWGSQLKPALHHGLADMPEAPRPTVASQSCIGLRVKPEAGIRPEHLLMYLRSADFQLQLDALRKGTTVAHITPAVLLQSVQVPVMDAGQAHQLDEQFQQLQTMDRQRRQLEADIQALERQLWPVQPLQSRHPEPLEVAH